MIPVTLPQDPTTLPPRLHLPQVLALAGYGRGTLWRRQQQHKMPKPIDRGPFGGIFERDAVLKALNIVQDEKPADNPWL